MAGAEDKLEGAAPAAESKAVKVPFVPLAAAVVVTGALSVAGAGGALMYLAKSGKLPMGSGTVKVEAATREAEPPTHDAALEPLLVNLADAGGHAYLRATLVLSVIDTPDPKGKAKEEKPEKGKPALEHDAEIRDAALSVMGGKTSAELLASGGKDALKKELRAAFEERVPETKIKNLYFTDFLVQQ